MYWKNLFETKALILDGALWSGKSPLKCLQLSNSGNILKLLVPNDGLKAICGWETTYSLKINKFNHSCRVISQMMIERKIDYRGSKSIIAVGTHLICVPAKSIVVKEQRVYGSWREKYNTFPAPSCFFQFFIKKNWSSFSRLRCTLMGFERNYKIRIHFNQIHMQERLFYSYKAQTKSFVEKQNLTHKMNPWFVTGFVDGEGCFLINMYKDNLNSTGWRVKLRFAIALHVKDKSLLQEIQSYLVPPLPPPGGRGGDQRGPTGDPPPGVGQIYKHGPESLQFIVTSFKELDTVVNHFKMYPLMTNKCSDFKLFIMVHEIIRRKEHLTQEGLIKIIAIKASMNWGVSEKLSVAFPDAGAVPLERPKVETPKTIDPNWLAGFTSAEGCFKTKITKSPTRVGYAVCLVYQLAQHIRDEKLFLSFIAFFNCGIISKRGKVIDLTVTKFQDIEDKIIPFFKKYKITGVKAQDFSPLPPPIEGGEGTSGAP